MTRRYNAGEAVPESGPQPVPPGEYAMQIVEASFGKSKTSGHDMVTVKATPVDGPYAGRKIRFYVTFPPTGHKNVGLALHFLKTIGEPYEGEFDLDETRWVGRRFVGVVGVEMFNGEQQNTVRRVKKLDENAPVPQPAQEEEIPF